MSNVLPIGFANLKGASARKHFFILTKLITSFQEAGYDLLIPSLLEYTNNPSTNNEFRFVDPLNNETISMRSDITEQIRDLANNQGDLEEMICYFGDIYYLKAEYQAHPRKLTQVGFENFTAYSFARNISCFKLILDSLKLLNINDLTLVISLPLLFDNLCVERKYSESEKKELMQILTEKNLSKIRDSKFSDFSDFILPEDKIERLNNKLFNNYSTYITEIETMINEIKNISKSLKIILDPFDCKHFKYHTNFAFTLYANKNFNIIARGGTFQMQDVNAIGSSLYVEEIMPLVK
jgi:ATP phosphoribosyltransferase regulatory subunit HisZ